jgi:hypothetical protein
MQTGAERTEGIAPKSNVRKHEMTTNSKSTKLQREKETQVKKIVYKSRTVDVAEGT